MALLKEFRDFAMKGNVLDLAVGVIIGAAFGKIVTSIVEDLVTPPLGILMGKVDFKDRLFVLPGQDTANLEKFHAAGVSLASAKANGVAVIAYGNFLSQVVQFLIVAFAIFIIVRGINRARALVERGETEGPPPAPTTKECPLCLSEVPIAAKKCKFCTADLP